MKAKLLKTFFLVFLVFAGAMGTSHAYHRSSEIVETFTWDFNVRPGEYVVKRLNDWKYVSKIVVQAEGIRRFSLVDVFANGNEKGSIGAPGADPIYTVTVGETINSIAFRHRTGATLRIKSITVYGRKVNSRGSMVPCRTGCSNLRIYGEASRIALRAIQLVELMDRQTRYGDYGQYLLPIKKVAARVYAKARSRGRRGDLSRSVHEGLLVLAAQIDCAEQFMDLELERDSAFHLVIELLSLRDEIYYITR